MRVGDGRNYQTGDTSDAKTRVAGGQRRLRAVDPFLRWPGGKRWLVPEIFKIIGDYPCATYREPFLGGGALFFALRPPSAVLSDINSDLINTYRQVRNRTTDVIEQVRVLPIRKSVYDRLRTSAPQVPLHRAVRFLYLNRTAFGGMYRLNRRGEFNVPFGGGDRTTAPLWERDLLSSCAKALRGARLVTIDFSQAMAEARRGDIVYCDPTYTVAHNNNGFVRYNERSFSWEDQSRLAESCREAAGRGALVIVSNAYHKEVLDLFSPPHNRVVRRISRLCPDVACRRLIEEYLFVFPPKERGKKPTGSHEK